MSRTIELACPDISNLDLSTLTTQSTSRLYHCQLVTPLFGGGVKGGVNDPITLIRPSSIRGQLRFWWRATRGTRCASIQELRQREGEIWGTPERPSLVRVAVEMLDFTPPADAASYRPRLEMKESPLPYVLFPFREAPGATRIDAARFLLEVIAPTPEKMILLRPEYNQRRKTLQLQELTPQEDDIQKDIDVALWAWVNFGGLGARTRRGCGALYCKDFAPASIHDISRWFTEWQQAFAGPETPLSSSIPMLAHAPLVLTKSQEAVQAWASAVDVLREFRQEGTGRKPRPYPNERMSKDNLPGRSHWPEPESIRAKASTRSPRHGRLSHIPDDAFPRAELGLPIIFHFQGENDGEPRESELVPKGASRMASPLVLRPLAVGNGNTAVAMILQLQTPPLPELQLVFQKKGGGKERPLTIPSSSLQRPDLVQYTNSPLGSPIDGQPPRSANGSALEAFLAFAKERGFTEAKA